jgi:5'-phosphate synthase pdxT subunit
MLTIGILCLQGAFIEHIEKLHQLHIETKEIRKLSDFDLSLDGLILPGGESTVMGRLLNDLQLFQPIKKAITNGLPVFGTCAGAILLARTILNDSHQWFQTMNITVKRNAYGRQMGSFKIAAPFKDHGPLPMVFIRAPRIDSVSGSVQILSPYDSYPTAAREKNMLVTTYHPEVTEDLTIHTYFVNMCKEYKQKEKSIDS